LLGYSSLDQEIVGGTSLQLREGTVSAPHRLCAACCIRPLRQLTTSMSELFSKVASRSIIDFIKETGFYRKI